MPRPHLIYGITDENGDLRRYTQVRILNEDGSKFTGKIYRDRLSPAVRSNPFVAAPALLDLYFAGPIRIRLGIIYDTSKSEQISEVLNVDFNADQTVQTVNRLTIEGVQTNQALLCGIDFDSAYWKPLRVDHEHEGIAPRTVLAGSIDAKLRQADTFVETTVLGSASGGWGAASSLRDASMLGNTANAYGRGTTAIGHDTFAGEAENPPYADGATTLGAEGGAQDRGVALGYNTDAEGGAGVVAIGTEASGAAGSLAIGRGATPAPGGVAIGHGTGSLSPGPPDSIGIGSGAQYGLPSDPVSPAIMLGALDPSRARVMPWANPNSSQSESPYDEYLPEMAFTGKTVQLQRHLTWLADITALQVAGDTTLGGPEGTLGFYGTSPVPKPSVGDDEPASGITALDNLIYALRDLGLVKYRTEVMLLFRAEDLQRRYLNGDLVTDWPEHFGSDTASYVRPGIPPTFDNHDVHDVNFNGGPTVGFDNSVYRRSSKPAQELRGAKVLPTAKHYVVVASHRDWMFGSGEGLLNLANGVVSTDNSVLTGYGAVSTVWAPDNLARYDRDGLNQSTNLDAALPAPHVYRVTNRNVWPHGRPVIGGPREQVNSGWDRWSGNIAEVVGLDPTWEDSHVNSLVRGLMFRYGIGQSLDAVQRPARDFMLTQHDPATGPLIFWKEDYSDSMIGKCYGRVTRMSKPIVYVPFISIYIAFNIFSFRGSLVGNWGNLSFSTQYEVQISVIIGDLDGDGDIDVATEFDASVETHIGIFSLNNNLTWSMGQISCNYGRKVCRIRHRVTKEVICISGDPPFRYADTEVRVYSTKSDGSLLLEGTSPLWGDGTYSVRVQHAGHKVTRVYEKSTNLMLASTERQEFAMPRTIVIANDDTDANPTARDQALAGEAAVTGIAFCDLGIEHRYRARHLARTLAKVQNDNGSINWAYSAATPVKSNPPAGLDLGTEWSMIFWLRYQVLMGDAQFLPNAVKGGDWIMANWVNGSFANTSRTVLAYFALRDLGILSGTAKYTTGAQTIKAALLANHWIASEGRFRETIGSDKEALEATAFGGLFLLAIGDKDKTKATVRHLKRFRTKTAIISASHYTGPTGLYGYKPYADGGAAPYVNPPNTIYVAATWAALLFKMRYGEPIGDDVVSLYRWQGNTITGDPLHTLYGAQFLSHSTSTGAPYNIKPRPNQGAAAWSYLLSRGARDLFLPDPLPTPTVSGLVVVGTRDPFSDRLTFVFSWTGTGVFTAYEAVPEQSVNAGQTWSPVSTGAISGPIEAIRTTPGGSAFATSWTVQAPDNGATTYRVRVRMRNAAFGAWVTSSTVGVPA